MFSCEPGTTLLWRITLYHVLLWARYDRIVTNWHLSYSLVSPVWPYCDELTSTIFYCKPGTTLLWRITLYHILLWAHYDLIVTNCPQTYYLVSTVRHYCDVLPSTIFPCKPSTPLLPSTISSCTPITLLLGRIVLYYILLYAQYDLIVTNCPAPYYLVSPVRPYCDELPSTIFSLNDLFKIFI